jgi:hypothetical protein
VPRHENPRNDADKTLPSFVHRDMIYFRFLFV